MEYKKSQITSSKIMLTKSNTDACVIVTKPAFRAHVSAVIPSYHVKLGYELKYQDSRDNHFVPLAKATLCYNPIKHHCYENVNPYDECSAAPNEISKLLMIDMAISRQFLMSIV